jgi:hypothetical protein
VSTPETEIQRIAAKWAEQAGFTGGEMLATFEAAIREALKEPLGLLGLLNATMGHHDGDHPPVCDCPPCRASRYLTRMTGEQGKGRIEP